MSGPPLTNAAARQAPPCHGSLPTAAPQLNAALV